MGRVLNVFPEFGSYEDRGEEERFPVAISNLNATIDHNLLQIYQRYNDAFRRQLHFLKYFAHKQDQIALSRRFLHVLDFLKIVEKQGHGAGVATGRLDHPLVTGEVGLVEKEGCFGGALDEFLGCFDVREEDLTHIGDHLVTSDTQEVVTF